MSLKPTDNPQEGPARALLELITEHPELPKLTWDIAGDSILRGSAHGIDVREAAEAWTLALGGDLSSPLRFSHDGQLRVSQGSRLVWRDVVVSLSFYSAASAYPELALVAVAS